MKTNKILIVCFLSSIAFVGCNKDSVKIPNKIDEIDANKYYPAEIFNGPYLDLYGTWKLYAVSGGFSGTGHNLNFDYFKISEIGIYMFVRNDSILEYGKVIINKQNDEALLITFDSDEDSGVMMWDTEKYVELAGTDTLTLYSPCCDRYNYHFSRVK